MLQPSKYVDTNRPEFKDKTELQIWMTLNTELQQWVFTCELLSCISDSIMRLGEKVGEAVIAIMSKKKGDK